MRYKLMALATVLLIGTPVFAQEMSPIIVETGNPTPSVVRSGELFKVTYRAKFYDEVIILLDQMQPEKIDVAPFEAVKLEVVSLPNQGDDNKGIIHVEDFIYTLRIIKPDKGDLKIPVFNFSWVIKKAGTTEDGAEQSNEVRQMPTEEVGVRYVPSPVTPPPMNIRDDISFSLPVWPAGELRNYGYASIAGSSLVFLLVLFFWTKLGRAKARKAEEKKSLAENVGSEVVADSVLILSPKEAKKHFLRELRKLQKSPDIEKPSMAMEQKIYKLLRNFLLVELRAGSIEVSEAKTPSEILAKLDSLNMEMRNKLSPKYEELVYLTHVMVKYYQDMESNSHHFVDPKSEIDKLIKTIEGRVFKGKFLRAVDYVLKGIRHDR